MKFTNPSFLYGVSSSWWDDVNALDIDFRKDDDDFNRFLESMFIAYPVSVPMEAELPPRASSDPDVAMEDIANGNGDSDGDGDGDEEKSIPRAMEFPPPAIPDDVMDYVACFFEEKIVPRPIDILQGRGRAMQVHPGNVWFRQMVASRSDEYRRSDSRSQKTQISRAILRLAALRGSKFFKETTVDGETMWQELTTIEARLKVAYTFRYIIQQMQQN